MLAHTTLSCLCLHTEAYWHAHCKLLAPGGRRLCCTSWPSILPAGTTRLNACVAAAAFMMACFTLSAISDENAEAILTYGGCKFDAFGNHEECAAGCARLPGLLLVHSSSACCCCIQGQIITPNRIWCRSESLWRSACAKRPRWLRKQRRNAGCSGQPALRSLREALFTAGILDIGACVGGTRRSTEHVPSPKPMTCALNMCASSSENAVTLSTEDVP